MNKIKLSVDDNSLDTVLSILNNLKDGLITNIEIDANVKTKFKATQYQPKNNKIIKQEHSDINDNSGKYLNASAYKKRLKKVTKNV